MVAVMASFKTLSQHLPGGTEEIHESPQDSRSPGRDLNLEPPEYEYICGDSKDR
jgi:hypothetical protein